MSLVDYMNWIRELISNSLGLYRQDYNRLHIWRPKQITCTYLDFLVISRFKTFTLLRQFSLLYAASEFHTSAILRLQLYEMAQTFNMAKKCVFHLPSVDLVLVLEYLLIRLAFTSYCNHNLLILDSQLLPGYNEPRTSRDVTWFTEFPHIRCCEGF